MSSITINGVTTEVYSAAELKALLAPVLGGIGSIEAVKYRFKIPTFRLFSKGKVVVAPHGFLWDSGTKRATTTGITTRRIYFDKAFVDALVVDLT